MKKITIIAAGMILSANAFAQTWSVDKAHSRIGFEVTHLKINEIDGNFKAFDAKFTSSKPDFSDATIEMTADVNSINTDVEQRDKHLKSPDFFDAANNPNVTFKSTSFTKEKGNDYKLTGQLTMHGVTKTVTLNARLVGKTIHPMNKKEMVGFRITGAVKRSEFGIGPSMPAEMISENIEIVANTEFSKDN